jgi:hypothetical protein
MHRFLVCVGSGNSIFNYGLNEKYFERIVGGFGVRRHRWSVLPGRCSHILLRIDVMGVNSPVARVPGTETSIHEPTSKL